MATCKECLHIDVCEAVEDMGIEKVGPSQCWCFKPAADVVEVVRCKDCKDYEPHGNGTKGICRNKKCNGLRYATDFCSYGERKSDDGSNSTGH